MTIAVSFLNEQTQQAAVYIDRPEWSAFTVQLTTDSTTPIAVPSVRVRFPTSIFAVGQAAKVTVASDGWQAAATGPMLTLTPSASLVLSASAPIVIALTGVVATATAATNDVVQVDAGGAAPTTKLFLMRAPVGAGDLNKALEVDFLPQAVFRSPGANTIENVLILRLVNRNPTSPLVSAAWARTPTVHLSFVYGDDIGSLTPDDAPAGDPHSAFNIEVDVSATYAGGKTTYEWEATPPDPAQTDVPPVWTLQPVPENLAVLGAGSGATAEFRISGLSTAAPAGNTPVYLQFTDFPGYDDCVITRSLSKAEPTPAIVFFDGVPTYVTDLDESVTLEWQTTQMARVELQQHGQPLDGPFDTDHGTYTTSIDRNTDFALLAYAQPGDPRPAYTQPWTARVPDARATFTADKTTVAAGSTVTLTWAIEFARAAEILVETAGGDPSHYDIPAADLAGQTHDVFPMRPTTYTLRLTGEGDPPDQPISVFVLPIGWTRRAMGFDPAAGQGPLLFGTDSGLILVGGQSANGVFESGDGSGWDKVGVAAFPARDYAAGCALGDQLWIMGGLQTSGHPSVDRPSNDVWSSVDGVRWTMATGAAPWPARSDFACAAFAQKLWVFGGRGVNQQVLGDVWSSPDGVAWTQVLGSAPWTPRAGAAVTVHQDQLWLFGGQSGDGTVTDDLWVSKDGTTWTKRGTAFDGGPDARRRATLASLGGNELYLFGGIGSRGQPLNDLQIYEGGGWDLGTGPSPWTISDPGFTVWRGALWFAGGTDGGASSGAVWSWFTADES
ncbi:MAG TPA: kelch repeat-containing protein [Conexibacter sp.]|jgi:N-acetylneuraminic acid mutarotase